MGLDNANPTILSVSELPSHRAKRNRGQNQKKDSIQALLSALPSYAMDPFYLSELSDTDSDDSIVEPIDEQEIYGEFGLMVVFDYRRFFRLHPYTQKRLRLEPSGKPQRVTQETAQHYS
jgi:hypothetical protein